MAATNFEGQRHADQDNEIVFFKVTNIELDVMHAIDPSGSPDCYMGATFGEHGCWVDAAQTRIVQAGIVQARVPDITGYLISGMFLFGCLLLINLPHIRYIS
jgi:peroxin-6